MENSLEELKEIDISDKDNVLNMCTFNTELSWEHLLLKNDNMNVMVKLAYLLNVKSAVSTYLIKQAVEENQDLLLNELIIGRIYNNGNILYGKLYEFLFLYKNKANVKGDSHCMCLMFYVLNNRKFEHEKEFKSRQMKCFNSSTNDLYWKYKNFRFINKDDINTLDNLFLNDNVINAHSSILYKLSHLYSCLAYCANQRKNFILSFTCYYMVKNETAAINALLNIYNDEYIYFYHNEAPEYKYIRKCAFRFYHLAKNMWPSNEKLDEIENKAHLILVILFMKKNMFEEAFNIFYIANLIGDHSLQKSSADAYFFIDLVSCYLMTLEEMCKKMKISELVTKRKLDNMVNILLPIKDRLHDQVIGSMNYLTAQQF